MEESEILELQLGMIKAIEALGKTVAPSPSPNVMSYSFWGNPNSSTNTVDKADFPKSMIKGGEDDTICSNTFSQPYVCIKWMRISRKGIPGS